MMPFNNLSFNMTLHNHYHFNSVDALTQQSQLLDGLQARVGGQGDLNMLSNDVSTRLQQMTHNLIVPVTLVGMLCGAMVGTYAASFVDILPNEMGSIIGSSLFGATALALARSLTTTSMTSNIVAAQSSHHTDADFPTE